MSTLQSIAYNNPAFYNLGGAPFARVVFTAVAGETYQIAVDGITFAAQGGFTFKLKLLPPPGNDSFSNAPAISGWLYETKGSFIGASREASEPSHSEPAFRETVWWSWTAPTNEINSAPMRLMADGVSFAPGVGVYSGDTINTLTAVPLEVRTNGMSCETTFNAIPGTTYHIALSGKQNDAGSVAPLVGYYRFRLNCRTLGLSITNLVTSGTNLVEFNADARIENLGAATSGPLRVSVSAISGLSTRGAFTASNAPPSLSTNLGIWLLSPATLNPGQAVLRPISGAAPAPISTNAFTQIGYGVYAELQEQPFGTNWFTVDETLVLFGEWPSGGSGGGGPGGGVIRLDPSYVDLADTYLLASVEILGPKTTLEGTPSAFSGRAIYLDFSDNVKTHDFTNTAWSVIPSNHFNITTNGVFTGSVTHDTTVSLRAAYSYGGRNNPVMTDVTVLNLPAPSITSIILTNGAATLALSGVAGRRHVIEAATNLVPPTTWLPMATNITASDGLASFLDPFRTNFSRRFFRARELE